MYIPADTLLGSEAVGGSVSDVAAIARRAGEFAHRVLTGAAPSSLPFEIRTKGVPMFDSHALKRWSIRLLSKLGNVGKTIKVHRDRAMDKMGVNLIAELDVSPKR